MPKLDDRIAALENKLKGLKDKQQLQERSARQAERQRARKAEAHRKFQLGGLLKLAGLFDVDAGALLGGLLSLHTALDDPTQFQEFKRAGDDLLARRERDKAPQPTEPPDNTYLQ